MFQPESEQAAADFIARTPAVTVHAHGESAGAPRMDLSLLNRVIDYPAADMTITVESGITASALQATLAEHNQHLPIDIPRPETMTIGDAVAQNLSGSRRFGYGTLRDYVIGIAAIDGQARRFKSGGRVVKNVAGYDLCKLLTGSHGTLGVITQLTLKVRPCCESSAGVRIAFSDPESLETALEFLPRSETRPVAMDVQVLPGGGLQLYLVFDGGSDEVRWQLDQIERELAADSCEELTGAAIADYLASVADLSVPQPGEPRFRAAVRPSALRRVFELHREAGFTAHAGNGILLGATVPELDKSVSDLGGWYRAIDADSNPFVSGPAAEMMKQVRRAFDPAGVFNPHISL